MTKLHDLLENKFVKIVFLSSIILLIILIAYISLAPYIKIAEIIISVIFFLFLILSILTLIFIFFHNDIYAKLFHLSIVIFLVAMMINTYNNKIYDISLLPGEKMKIFNHTIQLISYNQITNNNFLTHFSEIYLDGVKKRIIVNSPIWFDNIKVYQKSYGYYFKEVTFSFADNTNVYTLNNRYAIELIDRTNQIYFYPAEDDSKVLYIYKKNQEVIEKSSVDLNKNVKGVIIHSYKKDYYSILMITIKTYIMLFYFSAYLLIATAILYFFNKIIMFERRK